MDDRNRTVAKTYPEGVTSWIDTEQPDLDAAMRFYGAVLGWEFVVATPPDAPQRYVIATLAGKDVAGLGEGSAAEWRTYVAVDDIEATVRAIVDAGGTTTMAPTVAGEGGVAAAFEDPAGHELRLWQARRRLGAQLVNAPGAWNFSDLHAADPGAVLPFYERVFGWDFSDVGFATMIRRPGYGEHLAATSDPGIYERQAAVSTPPGFADAIGWVVASGKGHGAGWHVTFTVADRDAVVEVVRAEGGEVLDTDDNDWTRTALVRDPQGAVFTASQFIAG